MANKARGVTTIKLGDESFDITLGLGALAEIEDQFQVDSFEQALNFGDKISAATMRRFLIGLFKGNDIDMSAARKKALNQWTPQEFMELITDLLQNAGFSKVEDVKPAEGGEAGPLEEKNAGARG